MQIKTQPKRFPSCLVATCLLISCLFIMAGCGAKQTLQSPYSTSGIVKYVVNGAGLNGVTIQATQRVETPFRTGSAQRITTVATDPQGRFTFDQLAGEVTLTPVLAGWTFTPETQHVHSDGAVEFVAARESEAKYSVSGSVEDAGGNGIAGVTISFSGVYSSVQTDVDGNWTKSDVSGPVSVTPTKEGWQFEPVNRQIFAATEGLLFVGTPDEFSCSGKVIGPDGLGLAGVEIAVSGHSTVTTSASGEWSASGLSGNVTVTPSKSGYVFSPASRQLSSSVQNVDFLASETKVTYSVSGRVTNAFGSGISDVVVRFSDNAPSVSTDTDGRWSRADVTGIVVVTVSKSGWTFTPTSITVASANDTVDFTGTQQQYDVSGHVLFSTGAGLGGVTITFSNGAEAVITDPGGCWEKKRLAGTVIITPAKAGWSFTPPSKTVSAASMNINFIPSVSP